MRIIITTLAFVFLTVSSYGGFFDKLKGNGGFKKVTTQDKLEFKADGDDVSFYLNDQFIAELDIFGARTKSWGARKWEGVSQGHYLVLFCNPIENEQRDCRVSYLNECKLDANNQCNNYNGFEQRVANMNVSVKPSLKEMSATIGADHVEVSFDGKPLYQIKAPDLIEKGSKYDPLYSGQLGDINKALMYCYPDGSIDKRPIRCSLYQDYRHENNLLATTIVPFSESERKQLDATANRYEYFTEWPTLNPNKPNIEPYPKETKSKWGQLLNEVLVSW